MDTKERTKERDANKKRKICIPPRASIGGGPHGRIWTGFAD